jgi:hypothetical protein
MFWSLFFCGLALQEVFFLLFFFTLRRTLGIESLHVLEFVLGQAWQMANEQNQLPAVRIVAGLTPCGHASPTHAVVNYVEELTVAELLSGWKPHVRRAGIEIPAHFGVAASIIAVAGSAMIGKVPGRFLKKLR